MNTDFMGIVLANIVFMNVVFMNVVFMNVVFMNVVFMNVVFMNIDPIKIAKIIITIYSDNKASPIIYFININLLINI